MEKEKERRKFNLSRLLTLYLRRRNKSLQGSDPPEPPPAPGNTWTVKWPVRPPTDRPTAGRDELLVGAGKKKGAEFRRGGFESRRGRRA